MKRSNVCIWIAILLLFVGVVVETSYHIRHMVTQAVEVRSADLLHRCDPRVAQASTTVLAPLDPKERSLLVEASYSCSYGEPLPPALLALAQRQWRVIHKDDVRAPTIHDIEAEAESLR